MEEFSTIDILCFFVIVLCLVAIAYLVFGYIKSARYKRMLMYGSKRKRRLSI